MIFRKDLFGSEERCPQTVEFPNFYFSYVQFAPFCELNLDFPKDFFGKVGPHFSEVRRFDVLEFFMKLSSLPFLLYSEHGNTIFDKKFGIWDKFLHDLIGKIVLRLIGSIYFLFEYLFLTGHNFRMDWVVLQLLLLIDLVQVFFYLFNF